MWLYSHFVAFNNKVSDQMRRTLVLITKTIQNLANEQSFGNKEQFMLPLNTFISMNTLALHQFYDKIIVSVLKYCFHLSKESENPAEEFQVPVSVRNNALSALHNQLNLNYNKVVKNLQSENATDILEQLDSIMEEIMTEKTEKK